MKVKLRTNRKPIEILREAMRAAPRVEKQPGIRFSIRDLREIGRALAAYPEAHGDKYMYFSSLPLRVEAAIDQALQSRKMAKNESSGVPSSSCRSGKRRR